MFYCYFGVKDDLHDYAESIVARVEDVAKNVPIQTTAFGRMKSAVVHRLGSFQVELLTLEPKEHLPLHTHPGVDSIDYLLNGSLMLMLSGQRFAYAARKGQGYGMRIAQDAPHGGYSGRHGLTFVSIQRWNRNPLPSIALNWSGSLYNDIQRRLIDDLASVK